MIECDEMPDSLHETIYGYSKKGSMHRTLVLNLAFNTWDKSEMKRVEASEFRDDLFRYLADALRADGVKRRGVREVLGGLPQGVYSERERDESDDDEEEEEEEEEDDNNDEDDSRVKVEDYIDGEHHIKDDDHIKDEDHTKGKDHTEDKDQNDVEDYT